MRTVFTLVLTLLLASCGDYLTLLGFDKKTPVDTSIPILSENPGADISQYVLDLSQNAEIIVPPGSNVTINDVARVGVFSLIRTPTIGSFSEGNIDNALVITVKVLNVPNRTRIPFEITGISVEDIEAMILNGASVPRSLGGYFDLGAQGATGYANLVLIFKADQQTEGLETMTLRLLSSIPGANISTTARIDDTSRTPAAPVADPPQYILRKIPNAAAREGNINTPTTITLTTTGVDVGSTVPWTITGIDVNDIESMTVNGIPQTPSLGGSFIVGGQGAAGMVLIFKADQLTEGSETLVLALPTVEGTPTISVTINDTSTTPPVPPPPVLRYTLTKNPAADSFDEGNTGSVLSFRMSTENVNPGTQIPFTITGTGITAGDIDQMVVNGNSVTPALSGNFIIGQQGAPNYATVEIVFKVDLLTEGPETLTFTTPGLSGVTPITVTINDTSTTPPVYTDTIPPLITISYVNFLTANSTIPAGGSAADNVGVTQIKWINRTSATEGVASITRYGNIVAWTAEVPVVVGSNDIDFQVSDAAGLTNTESITVNGPTPPAPPAPVDAVAPSITITEQTGMDSSGVITVYGRATDNIGVVNIIWNKGGSAGSGSAAGVDGSGNTPWSANIPLVVGSNIITFTAYDQAGNSASIVLTQDVAGTGQNSFDGPQTEVDLNRDLIIEDRMIDQNRFKHLGINSEEIIDLTSFNIPNPPAEVHPCNKGLLINLPDNVYGVKLLGYENWGLLVSTTQINHESHTTGNYAYQDISEPGKVRFYWAQQLANHIHGAYDTGVTIDNTIFKLGTSDARVTTGGYTGPYYFSNYIGFHPLPRSRVELCVP